MITFILMISQLNCINQQRASSQKKLSNDGYEHIPDTYDWKLLVLHWLYWANTTIYAFTMLVHIWISNIHHSSHIMTMMVTCFPKFQTRVELKHVMHTYTQQSFLQTSSLAEELSKLRDSHESSLSQQFYGGGGRQHRLVCNDSTGIRTGLIRLIMSITTAEATVVH